LDSVFKNFEAKQKEWLIAKCVKYSEEEKNGINLI
jgi:hypothetical protein